ncbi:Phosphoglycolate phosphatase [Melia azedarach]|uniref:Phosphoglycolate phosphatase n=3 Tax=Melia azedarach TaxID=155640 RepID=A0ACC1YYF7_MELAZ|nr:Phosphoglycolate phosphatase [Melia azedarach]KAJ4728508.1 Phosphoglycolate phosphatase [Melia azedarach]
MAEYLASPTCIKLHMQRSSVKQGGCVPQNSNCRAVQRKCYHGRGKFVRLSMKKMCELRTVGVENLKVHPHVRENSLRCSCLGFLMNPDGATASDWVPVGDQVLLMASIFLTYLAGVIPVQKSNVTSQNKILDKNVLPNSSTSPGSARKNDENGNLKCTWQAVREKLLDSLDAIERGSNSGNRVFEFEQQQAAHPLSLYAVSEGPKLGLLWASFNQLEKEVNNISVKADIVNIDDWLTAFSKIIRESCQPICMAWLEKELCLVKGNLDEALISLIIEKLKGDDSILQNIIRSGKVDLYAELVFFLRYGTLRKGCSYDHSMFTLYADSILEDLVISLADGIASIYLELISVDSNLSNEINSLGLGMCNLSTRALQKLRNEVALKQWLYQNVEAVVSMYEDRFDLCTFESQPVEEASKDHQTENYSWWKKLTQRKSEPVVSALHYIEIMNISISVKRTKELRALTGWRYYFSLFLELSDISMPFIRAVFDKISNAISFFLVCLIGRSLGLIYTGIRQSLRWK